VLAAMASPSKACEVEAPQQASTSSTSTAPLEPVLRPTATRRERILQAVGQRDKSVLREFSAVGDGFEDHELRSRVWCVAFRPLVWLRLPEFADRRRRVAGPSFSLVTARASNRRLTATQQWHSLHCPSGRTSVRSGSTLRGAWSIIPTVRGHVSDQRRA